MNEELGGGEGDLHLEAELRVRRFCNERKDRSHCE